MNQSASAATLQALLDFSDDALCLFNSENLSLAMCNAPAARLLEAGGLSPQPKQSTLQNLISALLSSQSQSLLDDLVTRCDSGEIWTYGPRIGQYGKATPNVLAKRYEIEAFKGFMVKLSKSTSSQANKPSMGPGSPVHKVPSRSSSPSPEVPPVAGSRVRRKSTQLLNGTDAASIWAQTASPDVEALLQHSDQLHCWDAFKLDSLTQHHSLTTFTMWCLRNAGLIEYFSIPEDRLAAFLAVLETRYAENPYHNRMHAADVTRSVHVMLRLGMNQYFNEMQQLALYIGAAAHDAEHGGLSNAFLIATNDSLAITYHNTSPLENMHAAVLVRLLLQPSLNFLSHLPAEVFKTVRKFATDAILGTDPAAHRQHMESWAKHCPKWQTTVARVQSTAGAGLDMRYEMSNDEVSAALVMLLKCADLGHMSQPFENHKVWVELLTEEFYQQGDREKALGMTPLPFMNRAKGQCVASSQVGFMSFYALPMFEAMSNMFPEMLPITQAIQANFQTWSDMPKAEGKT